jgi:hypothetical protein
MRYGFTVAEHVRVPDWRPDQHNIPVAPTGAPPSSILMEELLILQVTYAWGYWARSSEITLS